MKCPKCQYISFDEGARCRNCGYEFALALDRPVDDLAVTPAQEGPLADFDLGHLAETPSDGVSDEGSHRADQGPPSGPRARPGPGPELPLFPVERPRDRPRLPPTASARPPLAVRRPTPPVPRLRERAAEASGLLPDPSAARSAGLPKPPSSPPAPAREEAPAGLSSRALAGLIDLTILGGVNLSVLHFTLQLSGLTWSDLSLLPWVPFVAFLLMVDGGYLVAFTATVGQTVGKMASGIRIAGVEPRGGLPPTLQQAVVRAASMLISVAPLGLGMIPALLASDRRALHDRLAGTRVIQAG